MTQRRGPGIQPPKAIGVKPGADPVVAKYTAGIVERAKASREKDRVSIPDLSAAMSQYRPGRDAPMTMAGIAQAQENIRAMSEPNAPDPNRPQLRTETVAGLKALHEAAAAAQQPPTPPQETKPATAEKPEEKKSFTRLSDEERRAAAETTDLDFDMMMARMRNDVINNEEERKAIEATLTPMDLADGLMTGEFRQFVPIQKGKLEVMYRSLSPMENEEMRRKILEEVLADERMSNQAGEKLAMFQMVASIHSLNGQEMPKHTKALAKGPGREFIWSVFLDKVTLFMNYPGPLIHALTTHAHWFDLRVRRLFSSTALKNG